MFLSARTPSREVGHSIGRDRGLRWISLLFIVVMMIAATGCEFNGAPPPDGQLAIERVAKWYQLYRADHRGKTPASEEKFLEFIEKELASRTNDPFDPDDLMTSPRDGQRYILNFKPNSKNLERNVAVYEQEGYKGKKLVAFESVWHKEVDDAELQALLAVK